MSSQSYQAATSAFYILLTFVVLWSIKITTRSHPYVLSVLLYLLTLALVGAFKFNLRNTSKTMNFLYNFLNKSLLLLLQPIIALEVLDPPFFVGVSVIFLSCFISWWHNSKLSHILIAASFLASLAINYYVEFNQWSFCLSIITISHYLLFEHVAVKFQIPKSILDSIGTIFLCIFVTNCI